MQKEIRFAIERTTSTGCQSHASAGAARALLRVQVGRRVLLREAADQSSGAGRHSSSDYGNSPRSAVLFPLPITAFGQCSDIYGHNASAGRSAVFPLCVEAEFSLDDFHQFEFYGGL